MFIGLGLSLAAVRSNKATTRPSGLTAVINGVDIDLDWDDLVGADTYNVYFSITPDFADATLLIDGLTDSNYTHSAPAQGATYSYWVTAVIGGDETPRSARAFVYIGAPFGDIVLEFYTQGNGRVSMTWSPDAQASTYNVYRSLSSGSFGPTLASGISVTEYDDLTVVDDDGPYYYIVTASNPFGEGPPSNEISADPPGDPEPVSELVQDAGVGATSTTDVAVVWLDPADNDPAFAYIELQLQTKDDDWSSPIDTTTASPGDQTAILGGGGLSPNTTYDLRARAVRGGKTSAWVTIVVCTRPAAPTGLTVPDGLTYDTLSATWSEPGPGTEDLTYDLTTDSGGTVTITGPGEADIEMDGTPGDFTASLTASNLYNLTSEPATDAFSIVSPSPGPGTDYRGLEDGTERLLEDGTTLNLELSS